MTTTYYQTVTTGAAIVSTAATYFLAVPQPATVVMSQECYEKLLRHYRGELDAPEGTENRQKRKIRLPNAQTDKEEAATPEVSHVPSPAPDRID